MKRYVYLVFIGLATFIFSSCEGPAGPPGANGLDGTDGVDGADGADGTVTCLQCHATTNMNTVKAEFPESSHAIAAATADHGTWSSSCARCHTTEGFQVFAETGAASFAVDNPAPWGCNTCHGLHETFEGTDYALRIADGDAVTFIYDDTQSHDFGNSNLCASCHQPRHGYAYRLTAVTATTSTIGSHYGAHYGVQATNMLGVNAAPITGATYTSNNVHDDLGCIDCHMSGSPANHTFNPDVAACTECHSGLTNFDRNGFQTTLEGKIETLFNRLVAAGLLVLGTEDDGVTPLDDKPENYEEVTGVEFNNEYIYALYNYDIIVHDGSLGIHNPGWIEDVLDASIGALPAVK